MGRAGPHGARDRRPGPERSSPRGAPPAGLHWLGQPGAVATGTVTGSGCATARRPQRIQAQIAATIAKLKSTEAKLRDTQSPGAAAVDKMKKKRSFGIDKHIAHTTEMV